MCRNWRFLMSILFVLSLRFLFLFDLEAFSIAAFFADSFALARNPFFFFGASRGPLTPLTAVM